MSSSCDVVASPSGCSAVVAELFVECYPSLYAIAHQRMLAEDLRHTLSATAVVHEAYLRMAGQRTNWREPAHFVAMAACMIRRVLIDHGRRRRAARRSQRTLGCFGGHPAMATGAPEPAPITRALAELRRLDNRQADLVELRVCYGLSLEQAAACLCISRSTASDDWLAARAFLKSRLMRHHDQH